MNPLVLVFLGIIALCALVQAVFFTVLAVGSWKAAQRVDEFAKQAEGELTHMARRVDELTAKVESLTRQAHDAIQRTEPMIESVAARTERAGEAIRHAAELPFVPFRNGAAIVHGVMRAIDTYRQARRPRPVARH